MAGATGDYTNQDLIEQYIGESQTEIIADDENNLDPDDIQAAIQISINFAEAFANRLARVHGFTAIPLPTTSKDFTFLQALVTKLAVTELYFRRAKRDETNDDGKVYGTYGRMTGLYKQARTDLEIFFGGVVDGSGAPDTTEPGRFEEVPIHFGDDGARC